MPLLLSPIDGSVMRQVRRYGIELDVCPTSGGVWLDKGELEKLIALISEEAEDPYPQVARRPQGYRERDDDDDDDDYRRRGSYKKRSRLLDLFDF